ncbi:hypothetical protein DMUE_1191 [Dictyocoela muelleri]|nr:hypothetical protein DMUE_1191 [Dictyocoela muelleri]
MVCDNLKNVEFINEHSHSADFNKCNILLAKYNIDKRAFETREDSRQIISNITKDISDDIVSMLSSDKSMVDRINKLRKQKIPLFSALNEDIPKELKIDYQGNKFLINDSGVNDKYRNVIFSPIFAKKFIELGDIFLIDGTFEISPFGFTQLVSKHIMVVEKSYPLIYILLKSKNEEAYKKAFLF